MTISIKERIERLNIVIGAIDFLLANPAAHTKIMLARDVDDNRRAPTDPGACKWCLVGRIIHDLGFEVTATTHQLAYNHAATWLRETNLWALDLIEASDTNNHVEALTHLRKNLTSRITRATRHIGVPA